MPEGTVKFFNAMKGFGFITQDGGGQDAFVHISAVEAAGLTGLDTDQRVSFELEPDRRGRESAANLKLL
ncbi:cold-shock protein [Sphingomonas sp.]|uniref:cold-shock protein n=1 Tax=Sphingomonas sp. TaxID=28214 RepID=UPI00286AD6B0|nr:cold-shock protein [Sphingomonas sp.]